MTPKEKAEELVSRFRRKILRGKHRIDGFVIDEIAEECALIAVDEIIDEVYREWDIERMQYLTEVKKEIEKL